MCTEYMYNIICITNDVYTNIYAYVCVCVYNIIIYIYIYRHCIYVGSRISPVTTTAVNPSPGNTDMSLLTPMGTPDSTSEHATMQSDGKYIQYKITLHLYHCTS